MWRICIVFYRDGYVNSLQFFLLRGQWNKRLYTEWIWKHVRHKLIFHLRMYKYTRCGRNVRRLVFYLPKLFIFFKHQCNYYKNSREKFEPEPGFEPRTSEFLARRSTTWAILVLSWLEIRRSEVRIPVLVQIFLLRPYNVNFLRHKLCVCFQCYQYF